MEIPKQLQNKDFRFVPIKNGDKKPIGKCWQTTNNFRYYEKEIKKNDAYGVVGGFGNLYIVDVDKEELREKLKDKLPKTFTVKSGGKGLPHYYFISDSLPKSFKLKKNEETYADIQGVGKQAIGPNSIHCETGNSYEIIEDIPITKFDIEDIKKLILEIYKDLDIQNFGGGSSSSADKLQICKFHKDKNSSLAIYNDTGTFYCFGCGAYGFLDVLDIKKPKVKETTNGKFHYIERDDYERYKNILFDEETDRKKKTTKETEEGIIRTSLHIDKNKKIIAEQIYNGETSLFCVYHTDTEKIEYVDKIQDDEIIMPIVGEEIEKGAILLPSEAKEYNNDEELNKEIITFINKWLDVPKDILKFSLWNIKLSWVFQRFHTINYLRAMGDTGQGKSRYLDTIGSIHYKPIFTSGATTSAPIFRVINKWRGTLLMDEADLNKSDEANDIIKIINMGYEEGKFVMRCEQNNATQINFFDPFCPKVICTRKPFDDKATESRCITYTMIGTKRKDIPPNINRTFKEEAKQIRNKLLMWRFRNYYKIEPEKKISIDLGEIEPRIRQIVSSLINLFIDNEKELEEFKTFIQNKQEEIIEDRQNSFTGEIVGIIHKLVENKELEFDAKDIVEKGSLTNFKGNELSPRALSKPLKEIGFGKSISKKVDGKTKRVIPLDVEHLTNLFKRYGYDSYVVMNVTIVTDTSKEKKTIKKQEKNTKVKKSDISNYRNHRNFVTPIIDRFSQEPNIIDERTNKIITHKGHINFTIRSFGKTALVQDVVEKLVKNNHNEEDVERLIESMKKQKEIFEPRSGYIQLLD